MNEELQRLLDELRWKDPTGIRLTEETILHWFDLCNAVWIHDGDPKKPHAELTSGFCSNGYFNCPEVLKYPTFCEILAVKLARKIEDKLSAKGIEKVDWVIGSPYAAITLSYEIAKDLGAIHGFTEKDPINPEKKRMLWKRMTIPENSTVQQAEDLMTTMRTAIEVRRAVQEGNSEKVNFLPFVATLIFRPPDLSVDTGGIEVLALVEKEIWAVDPKECPLCKAGSLRYRPKTHWQELTGKNLQ